MTHFVDLSPYAYYDDDIIENDGGWITYRPRYQRINVGWLDAPHDFTTGSTPRWLPDALLGIIAGPGINTMRGFHRCTLCPNAAAPADTMTGADHVTGTLLLGHAEIRIPARAGTMYAAPNLIWHYITAHRYRPPDDVIEAVKNYDNAWTTEPSPWIPDDADHMRFD